MGEAKRRRLTLAADAMIYHHTSTLRTNLLWMSGVIELEGLGEPALHPILGEIRNDALIRRPLIDFPRVAWFTVRTAVPKVLQGTELRFVNKDTGEPIAMMKSDVDISNAIAMHRIAIGFPLSATKAVKWTDHAGYTTREGRDLNESAIEAGDDPDDWYVSEVPLNILLSTEIWGSRSKFEPKMERLPNYLVDVHNLVRLSKSNPNAYIPPSYLTQKEAEILARSLRVPWMSGGVQR